MRYTDIYDKARENAPDARKLNKLPPKHNDINKNNFKDNNYNESNDNESNENKINNNESKSIKIKVVSYNILFHLFHFVKIYTYLCVIYLFYIGNCIKFFTKIIKM